MLLVACAATADAPKAFDAQGHRGARGLLPENTLPAFERALELGVSTLELDLGVTRDGVVVVGHDPRISPKICRHRDGRPLVGEGPRLRDLSLAEVVAFDCGSLNPDRRRFPEPPFETRPGTSMPTLDQLFRRVAERGDTTTRFNIETKLRPGDRDTVPMARFVDAVLAVVDAHGLRARVSLQSFDWRSLARVRERAPEIETVALVAPDTLDPAWLNGIDPAAHDGVLGVVRAASAYVDAVSPYWRMLVETRGEHALSVSEFQAAGFPVVPWTVNEPEAMRRLLALGVDGIISDYPDRLLEVLREASVPVRGRVRARGPLE